ncbi:hypothetical protein ACFQGT_09220 [Natrialbaceae archaeon GCM10025810]|uniref:hypothetical protein n=1 Tax=Halovalidus salilacus TaxID=3075124 RepID=UPI0036229017
MINIASLSTLAALGPELLYHNYGGSEGWTGFPQLGTFLIFVVILMPVYVMVVAWFLGRPKDNKTGLLGVSYLVGITTSMWGSMLILTIILGLVFFGGLPGQ